MKSSIPNRTDIDLRQKEINLRLETGHYECDSIEGQKAKKETAAILYWLTN